MNRRTLITRYALFAAVATAVNMGLQAVVLALVRSPAALYLAIAVGTVGGLIVKYVLDCRFIFAYVNKSTRQSLVTFILYAAMSGVTTAIFWGVELIFDAALDAACASYVGAAVGLTLGYGLKYQLDRKFVFSRRSV